MKKKLILCVLVLLIYTFAKAQTYTFTPDSTQYKAGIELTKASRNLYAGTAIIAASAPLIYLTNNLSGDNATTLVGGYVGLANKGNIVRDGFIGVNLIGVVLVLKSFYHIGNAGNYLSNRR